MTSVLVIDDSRQARQEIGATLVGAGLFDDCRTAADGIEGFRSLAEARPDLVVCDLAMPRLDGMKFLQMLHSRPELRDIPVIMLTANQDRGIRVRGLEQGACDFLTKPFDPPELVARARIHLKIKKLQDQLREAHDHFKELSNTDPLTGLYNRRFLMEILESELQRSRRLRSPLSLMIVDLDGFKEVNDRHGHQAGDLLLAAVADELHHGLRSYDVASRYGGDEFVLLLPGTSRTEAGAVAERLRLALQKIAVPAPEATVGITASIGIASLELCDQELAVQMDALLRRADQALYRAKEGGRNRVAAL